MIHRWPVLLEYRLILKIQRFIVFDSLDSLLESAKQVPAVYKFIPIKLNVIVVVIDLPRLFTFDFVQLGIIQIFFEQFSTRLRIYTASGRRLYEFFRKQTRLPILKRNMSFSSYYTIL